MDKTEERLRILTNGEIEELYGRPNFTDDERRNYFALTPLEKAYQENLRSIKSGVHFILQLGYFKARQMLFPVDFEKAGEDINYILGSHFHGSGTMEHGVVNKRTRLKHEKIILTLCGYNPLTPEERKRLEEKAQQAAKVSGKPVYIFRALMDYLAERRVVLPGYRLMQDTIGMALTNERVRLLSVLKQNMTPQELTDLDSILSDSGGLHEITQIRRDKAIQSPDSQGIARL